ncbi:MAG TPA: cyclase family protein [Gemmatimonadales bacterium]
MIRCRAMVTSLSVLVLLMPLGAMAQTREKGPWWPHPIWGKDDRAGGSNWITPEKIRASLSLVTTGKVYELGQVYEAGMPLYGERTYSLTIPGPAERPAFGANNLLGNEEMITGALGQVGTQFDGPGHIGVRLRMADGTDRDVYYNGFTWEEIRGESGLREIGIEHIKPIVTRGVLIDIAGYKNVPILPPAYEVTLADVRGALSRQRMSEAEIQPGDAIFFGYGWAAHWKNPKVYGAGQPGIGLEVARWIVERRASMVGSDSPGLEVTPNPRPDLAYPVHQVLITENGIWNQENLHFEELVADRVYQFLFIFTPVRFKGATGSPGRPIAIR